MAQTRSKSTSKPVKGKTAKAATSTRSTLSAKRTSKLLDVLTNNTRTAKSALGVVLSQPAQDLKKAPGGASWINLSHDFEALIIQSNRSATRVLSIFEEFTGDLHTFLMGKSIGYDVKAKDFDVYLSQLTDISRNREPLQASDKLDNLQALISAAQPPRQSFFTSLLASFGSLFASKRQQVSPQGPKGPKPQDNNRLKRQARERDAAIKAMDQLLRKLRAMNYADVVDSFSLEVNKARTALRQCESSSHTVNSERHFQTALGATHKSTMELVNSLRGYKNALEENPPSRR